MCDLHHTPTPWHYFRNDADRSYVITDNTSATAAGIGHGTNVIAVVKPVSSGSHHRANAKLIVQACHSHAALVNSARWVIQQEEAGEIELTPANRALIEVTKRALATLGTTNED